MRLRIAIVAIVLATLGSSAEATVLNIVDCATGKPIRGVQKQALERGRQSETIQYQVSAPGFATRTVSVYVGTVTESCLEPATPPPGMAPAQTPAQSLFETQPGSRENQGKAAGGKTRRGDERSRDHLLMTPPGLSAEDRARRNLDTYERRPAIWVDTGPATDVDSQIDSLGGLLDAGRSHPPTRTKDPAGTSAASTPDTAKSDPPPKIVPDDTGLYRVEDIADPECVASPTSAGATGRDDNWGSYCSAHRTLKRKLKLRREAKDAGKDPNKVAPLTSQDAGIQTWIESGIQAAEKLAQASCATKIYCKKVACKTQCDVVFNRMIATDSCKLKRRIVNGKMVRTGRLRVDVIGDCGCACAAKSACAGIESAL